MVNLECIDFPATSPYPRTVRASLADGPLVHLRCVSRAQSLGATSHPRAHSPARALHLPSTPLLTLSPSHSPQNTSLSNSKPWRSSPIFPTIEAPPPRRSTTGGRRRTTPTNCTTPISSSSLGRSFPNKLLPLLHSLPQAQARRTTPSYSKPSPAT